MKQCNTQVPIVERLLRNDIRICGIKPFCLASRKATRASQNAVISPDKHGPGQNGLPGHEIADPPLGNWMRSSMAQPDEMRYFMQSHKKLYSKEIASEMRRVKCGKARYTILLR